MKLRVPVILALTFAAVLISTSGEARAATQSDCVVTQIQSDNSPRLAIWCSGVGSIHYIYGAAWGGNCGTVSDSTMKSWQMILQSAVLSGRKVDIDYNDNTTCVGSNIRIVSTLRLKNT